MKVVQIHYVYAVKDPATYIKSINFVQKLHRTLPNVVRDVIDITYGFQAI